MSNWPQELFGSDSAVIGAASLAGIARIDKSRPRHLMDPISGIFVNFGMRPRASQSIGETVPGSHADRTRPDKK